MTIEKKKPWLTSYPAGVKADLPAPPFSSLSELITQTCKLYAKQPAFSSLGQTLTFEEVDEAACHIAAFLQKELGLKAGERVAIMMPNVLQNPVTMFACLKLGLIVVNVNPLYTARELEHQLQDAQVSAIILLENFAHTLEKVLEVIEVKHVIISKLGDMFSFPKSMLINTYIKCIKRKVPHYKIKYALAWRNALKKGESLTWQAPKIKANDIAFLQYTGGTTGRAKGAMLTHANILANVQQITVWLSGRVTLGKEVALAALPIYHIFCLVVNVLAFFSLGARNVLIINPREIKKLAQEFHNWPFSLVTGVNTLFNALLDEPTFRNANFSHFKYVIGGGAAVKEAVAKEWHELTQKLILEGYGLTECSPVVSVNSPELEAFNGSIGLPLPGTDISIRDDKGRSLGIDKEGELWVKGPQVMKGYWHDSAATQETINKDGWLKTGDIAKVDNQGYVYIVDRKKDMILVSGFNVYPNEIEEVIMKHPFVQDVACVGVPDKKCGEVVKAFVVGRKQDVTREDIQQHCRQYLTGYKIPKHIEFCEELPKSNVGKVIRRHLRASESENKSG